MMELLSSDQHSTVSLCNQGWYALKRSVQTGALEATAIAVNSNNEPKIEYDDEEKTTCYWFLLHVKDPPPSPTKNSRQGSGNTSIGTRLLLSDDLVQIWEFRLDPHECCPFHCHSLEYFFINLAVSETLEMDSDGNAVDNIPRSQTENQITFVPYQDLGAHGVKNVGTSVFQQFIDESKDAK